MYKKQLAKDKIGSHFITNKLVQKKEKRGKELRNNKQNTNFVVIVFILKYR